MLTAPAMMIARPLFLCAVMGGISRNLFQLKFLKLKNSVSRNRNVIRHPLPKVAQTTDRFRKFVLLSWVHQRKICGVSLGLQPRWRKRNNKSQGRESRAALRSADQKLSHLRFRMGINKNMKNAFRSSAPHTHLIIFLKKSVYHHSETKHGQAGSNQLTRDLQTPIYAPERYPFATKKTAHDQTKKN